MGVVRIARDGFFFEYEESEGGPLVSEDMSKGRRGILSYLDSYVEIDEGVCVRDIFNTISRYEADVDAAFDCCMSSLGLAPFLEDAVAPADPDPNLYHLKFSHSVEYRDGEIIEAPLFHGVGRDLTTPGAIAEYSVEMAPIGAYVNLHVQLDRTWKMKRYYERSGEQFVEVMFEAHKEFTLRDVLTALLTEVSRHGLPSERAVRLEELLQEFEDTLSDAPSPSEVQDLVNDEVRRLEDQLRAAVDGENYEEASKIRDRIKQMRGEK